MDKKPCHPFVPAYRPITHYTPGQVKGQHRQFTHFPVHFFSFLRGHIAQSSVFLLMVSIFLKQFIEYYIAESVGTDHIFMVSYNNKYRFYSGVQMVYSQ